MASFLISTVIALWLLLPTLLIATAGPAAPSECVVGKDCFAVAEPHMVERACTLYAHERQLRPDATFTVTQPNIELSQDQLHVEFLKMVKDKKFINLKEGTPIFGCAFELQKLAESDGVPPLRLPEFNCNGLLSGFIAVRPLNSGTCYWLAVEDVVCK